MEIDFECPVCWLRLFVFAQSFIVVNGDGEGPRVCDWLRGPHWQFPFKMGLCRTGIIQAFSVVLFQKLFF